MQTTSFQYCISVSSQCNKGRKIKVIHNEKEGVTLFIKRQPYYLGIKILKSTKNFNNE